MTLIDPPQPGVYHKVPAATYHSWNAVSHSWLKLIRKSPRKLRKALDARIAGKDVSTPTQRLGRGYHEAVADFPNFEKMFVKAGMCCTLLKSGERAGKECGANASIIDSDKNWYCGTHKPMLLIQHDEAMNANPEGVLRAADYDKCIEIRDRIAEHPQASELFGGQGMNEISIVWEDEETGLLCKERPDRIAWWHWGQPDKSRGWMTHIDIKGTEKDRATIDAFGYDTYKWGYYMQDPFYLDGCYALERAGIIPERSRRFAFCVVDKSDCEIAIHELDLESRDAGRRDYKTALHKYKRCLEANKWPDRYKGPQLVSIPERAL